MTSEDRLIVIGAGHAGVELALAARQAGWAGPIVLVGDEPELPYHRPPLSKAYLHGKATRESLLLRAPAAYEKAEITLMPGRCVTAIDRAARAVTLDDGATLPYTALAICTGGEPRRWVPPGLRESDQPNNVMTLRTLADTDALAARLQAGTRLTIIGGGYVGLELAASATQLGVHVTVLEAMPHVLARVTSPIVAAFYERVHREAGVSIHTGFKTAGVQCANSAITAIVGSDGALIPTDLVVAGIGMQPRVALAEAAGLNMNGGIVIDAQCRTSDPHIWAAGDCTVQHHALYGRELRLESVPNALAQARTAAAAICGKPAAAVDVPWFWSDQYDLKLQMVGLSQGHELCVIRGDMTTRKFVAFYLRDGVVIAADAVSSPADFVMAKKLVASQARLPPEQLQDPGMPLKDLAASVAPPTAP